MSSSTSTSEQKWRRLLSAYLVWGVAFCALAAAFIVLADPYDTGRFGMFPGYGVPQFGQRLASASLARRPEFDEALIGNSTLQLVDPSRVNEGRHRAVSLTIPGTGPIEQLTVASWFISQHVAHPPHALVIGIDDRWCDANRPLELTNPFPFWLYGNASEYLESVFRYQNLEAAFRKIGLMLGANPPARADGYNDYEAGRDRNKDGLLAQLATDREGGRVASEDNDGASKYQFEALSLLRAFVKQLPDELLMVLVVPPKFRAAGDGIRAQERACVESFNRFTRDRPRTVLIDFLTREDLATRADYYWDRQHYGAPVARVMETAIAAVLERP